MPNYKKMYFELFNEITDTIERLKHIQTKTEEMHISEEPVDLCKLEKIEKREQRTV